MAKETFSPIVNLGALWTGIGAPLALKFAEELGGLTTLEKTPAGALLDHGHLKSELDRDFGPAWCAEKRIVFDVLSRKFVEALEGMVTIFLPQGIERPRDGAEGSVAYALKIIWNEIRDADFGDPRIENHKITSMRVCYVAGGEIVSTVFMAQSNQLH
jgi:hypothetical protein